MQVGLTVFVGVDVAKAKLDVAYIGTSARLPASIPNEAGAIDAWLASLPAGAAVAMESTGRWHQLLARRAFEAGIAVYVLNAGDVSFYGKALGARAKTDRLDCQVIAQYLAEQHRRLHRFVPARASVAEIETLLRQRSVLVTKRVALRQAFKDCPVGQALEMLEEGLTRAEKALDARIEQLIEGDPELQADHALLHTITGFGARTSALLATLFSRIRFAHSDALVAYCGLDPRANDSGTKRGRRSLSKKGPPELRRTMYLAAFAACHSKAYKPTYQALKARGLKPTEALVILARKLLRAAFAVWKSRQPFDPARIGGLVSP